ncbi:hypothetical protein IPH70_02225 [Candidatus Roizmanbacteria bacterium]|nr:MAG: hypothetical protein IPH70_02225 [Candidatus Roizmanbacteria bacterium]
MTFNILHLYRNQTIFGHWTKLANELPRYAFINGKLTNQLTVSKKTEPIKYSRPPILNSLSEEETPEGFKTLAVGNDKGLFFFSPILILFLLSFWQYNKKQN